MSADCQTRNNPCRRQFRLDPLTGDNMCYRLKAHRMDYSDAKTICQSLNSTMFEPRTEGAIQLVEDFGYETWIGIQVERLFLIIVYIDGIVTTLKFPLITETHIFMSVEENCWLPWLVLSTANTILKTIYVCDTVTEMPLHISVNIEYK
ncbi:hypothetical protein Btru_029317 [Bulinus truncatus]|nr:hypothetical protein Btru_029317 [Bulinus truncatus]